MCGRFVQIGPVTLYTAMFDIKGLHAALARRYNVAPTQSVTACREQNGRRELRPLRWGLLPQWSKGSEASLPRPLPFSPVSDSHRGLRRPAPCRDRRERAAATDPPSNAGDPGASAAGSVARFRIQGHRGAARDVGAL